jgi:hypothetical protein
VKTIIDTDQSDIEALHAYDTSILRTVPGTERVIGTPRREPVEDEHEPTAQRFRRSDIEPVGLGYHHATSR